MAFLPFAFSALKPTSAFSASFHHAVIADAFERALLGDTTRAIINAPPRTLKSFVCSIAGVSWAIGRSPDLKVMVIAGTRGLASDLFDQVSSLLSSSLFGALFPSVRIAIDRMTIRTNAGGTVSFSGFRQTQIGRGADLIVLDDPMSPTDAQDEKKRIADGARLRSEIIPRFNDPERGRLVLVSQRLHRDDLVGQIQSIGIPSHTVSIPAIAVQDEEWVLRSGTVLRRSTGDLIQSGRLSLEALQGLLASIGGYRFKPQYQQDITVPFGSYGEYRVGKFYYPAGHEKFVPGFFGPSWFFGSVPETAYTRHELFGGIELPRPYDETLKPTPEQWQSVAVVQQRMLVQSQTDGRKPPTIQEVLDEVARTGGLANDL